MTFAVAPPVGAWIEIGEVYDTDNTSGVAPPVGAWIEIGNNDHNWSWRKRSLPPWERGLKSESNAKRVVLKKSLPPWERGLKLEIKTRNIQLNRRSPRGSVD